MDGGLLERVRRHGRISRLLGDLYQRDNDLHGAIFAGAVAFRLFLWMLPLTLAIVAGLGFIRESGADPEAALRNVGIGGLSASTIAEGLSASSTSRWYAALFGLVFLYPTSTALAKVVHRAHALAWGEPQLRLRAPVRAAGAVVIAACGTLGITGLAVAGRSHTLGRGLVVEAMLLVLYALVWLGLSLVLPHRGTHWRVLVPGALLFGAGVAGLHYFTVVYLARKLTDATDLYGGLGSAAAMLTFLYLLARLIVVSPTFNAVLFEEHLAGPAPAAAREPGRSRPAG